MDFHAVLQKAVDREDGALAQRALVGRVLNALGHREQPEQRRTPQGVEVTWRGTLAGDVVLVGGKIALPAEAQPPQGVTVPAQELPRSAFGAVARAALLPEDRKRALGEAATALRHHFLRRFNREQEIRQEREKKYRLQEEVRAVRAAQRSQKGQAGGTLRG